MTLSELLISKAYALLDARKREGFVFDEDTEGAFISGAMDALLDGDGALRLIAEAREG